MTSFPFFKFFIDSTIAWYKQHAPSKIYPNPGMTNGDRF